MKKNKTVQLHIDHSNEIKMISLNRINVLNPRSRNKKIHAQLIENISKIGLKRPITVTETKHDEFGPLYNLVCGQGRLEAFQILGEQQIPCMVIETEQEESFLISLVENLARRKHSNRELLNGIQILNEYGYNNHEIARKTGLHYDYINCILHLLTKGEERLIAAVEKGWVPLDLAMDISRSSDSATQLALLETYEQRKLTSTEIMRINRVITQRKSRGKDYFKSQASISGHPNSDKLVKVYKTEMQRQKLMVKKSDINEQWLQVITRSLNKLLADEHFNTLMRAEGITTLPSKLAQLIDGGN